MKQELPNITWLAVLLIVGLIISSLGIFFSNAPIYLLSPEEIGHFSLRTKFAIFIVVFLKAILNIFIAIWLFNKAKKQNESAITWTILGIFFGLFALILFYLVMLTKEIKKLNSNFQPTQDPKNQ